MTLGGLSAIHGGIGQLGMSLKSGAFNWYVDSVDGNDANSGSSISAPLKTLSALVAKTITAGQKVGLKSGSTFRETLTVPSSGSSGSPITYMAYGTGNKPVISGADVITGWENTWPAEASEAYGPGSVGADIRNGAWMFRVLIPATAFTANGTGVKVRLGAGAGGNCVISAAYIGEQASSGDAYDIKAGTITQFLFGGNAGVTITAGSTAQSDALTFAIDKTKVYVVSIGVASGRACYTASADQPFNYFKANASAEAGTENVTGMTANTNKYEMVSLTNIIPLAEAQENTWAKTCAVSPAIVNFDGNYGIRKTAINELVADYDFCWKGGFLFTYTSDDADPDTKYTLVEISQRNCVNGNAKNYITYDGLRLTCSNSIGITISGNTNIVQNCTIDHVASDGVLMQTGSTGSILQMNDISYCWNGIGYTAGGALGRGIALTGGVGIIVRRNKVYSSYLGIVNNGASESKIHYNLVYNNRINGIDHIAGVADHPALIYNNTVLHNPGDPYGAGHGIDCQGAGGGWVNMKNNLILMPYTGTNINVNCHAVGQTNYSGVDLDYNLVFKTANSTADLYKLESNLYNTLANWQTALGATAYSGKAAHDVQADPLVVSLVTPDLHIQVNSPAIGAGVDVGLTEDYDGNPVGTPPCIGAFEYVA